jgi:pimeloyl-ACP methyl ester carboxylesterase
LKQSAPRRARYILGWPGGHALELIDHEALVALAGELCRHAPGGDAVAVVVQDPAYRLPQRPGAGVLPDPQARSGLDHPGGVVGLIPPERHHDQRHPGGQRLHHGAVTAVRDHGRAVRQHVGVAGAASPIPPRHGVASAALIPGARHVIEDDCGHFIWLERPGSVRRALQSISG